MFGAPDTATYNEVKQVFGGKFLCKQCEILGLKDSDRRKFAKFLIKVSARYLELNRLNSKRSFPGTQKDFFTEYGDSISALHSAYSKIIADRSAETKFHVALRQEYNTAPNMKAMLNPYMTDEGYHKDTFSEFLELLKRTAEAAKVTSVGSEKTELYRDFLTWWVGEIKLRWPENSPIPFKLGGFIKTDGKDGVSEYDSKAREFLFSFIKIIDKRITEEMVETSMRKVIAAGQDLYPAKFFLE